METTYLTFQVVRTLISTANPSIVRVRVCTGITQITTISWAFSISCTLKTNSSCFTFIKLNKWCMKEEIKRISSSSTSTKTHWSNLISVAKKSPTPQESLNSRERGQTVIKLDTTPTATTNTSYRTNQSQILIIFTTRTSNSIVRVTRRILRQMVTVTVRSTSLLRITIISRWCKILKESKSQSFWTMNIIILSSLTLLLRPISK